MWQLDGMDDLFAITGLGTVAFICGDIMRKVGKENMALGLDIIASLIGLRVVLLVFKGGVRYVENMFDLM
jgi:hypothetical protein